MTTWQQWVPFGLLFLIGLFILSELGEASRLLRQIYDEMILARLAAEESGKALVMIQDATFTMKRTMERPYEDPAISFFRESGE